MQCGRVRHWNHTVLNRSAVGSLRVALRSSTKQQRHSGDILLAECESGYYFQAKHTT